MSAGLHSRSRRRCQAVHLIQKLCKCLCVGPQLAPLYPPAVLITCVASSWAFLENRVEPDSGQMQHG